MGDKGGGKGGVGCEGGLGGGGKDEVGGEGAEQRGGQWQSSGFSVNKPSAWPSQLTSGHLNESSLAKWKGLQMGLSKQKYRNNQNLVGKCIWETASLLSLWQFKNHLLEGLRALR